MRLGKGTWKHKGEWGEQDHPAPQGSASAGAGIRVLSDLEVHSHIHQQGSGCHGRDLWQDKTYFFQIAQAGNFN